MPSSSVTGTILVVVGVLFVWAGIKPIIKKVVRGRNKGKTRATLCALLGDENITVFTSADGSQGIGFDQGRRRMAILEKGKRGSLVAYQDVVSSEILLNGSLIDQADNASQVGRAMVGGLLFGAAGAIVGAVTSKRIQSQSIESLTVRILAKGNQPFFDINFYVGPAIQADRIYPTQRVVQDVLSTIQAVTAK